MNATVDRDTTVETLQRRLAEGSLDVGRDEVVALVSSWIAKRQPAAIVRFGEGEGRLIVAEPDDEEAIAVARNKIKRQTGLKVKPAAIAEIRENILHAFDEADIVGIHGDASFNEEHLSWVHRIEAAYAARASIRTRANYVTHCLLSNWIRDALPELIGGHDQLSLISCRDLEPYFKDHHAIRDLAVYKIPSQFVVRDVDGAYEAELHGTPIWPDHIKNIERNLVVRRKGEVFLVGAGLFGKHLCVLIRERGGIAIDLGSCLDGLANKPTRGAPRRRALEALKQSEAGEAP